MTQCLLETTLLYLDYYCYSSSEQHWQCSVPVSRYRRTYRKTQIKLGMSYSEGMRMADAWTKKIIPTNGVATAQDSGRWKHMEEDNVQQWK